MINTTKFGQMPDGEIVEQFTLTNGNGLSVDILNLGGIVRRWLVPAANNTVLDIVLGFDTVEQYLKDDSYLGALVGRYANRINKGQFPLDNQNYQVDVNQGTHSLHGGGRGFNSRIWTTSILSEKTSPSLMLELTSPHGDQGFPGKLAAKVIYTLTEGNTLKIEYFATCDHTTLYNPTNHSYFNLAGHNSGSVKQQQIQLNASHFTPTDKSAIPTGVISSVENTPFDFRQLTPVSIPLTADHEQIQFGDGLDHNLCLDAYTEKLDKAVYSGKLTCEASQLTLKVYTSMPGMQIFTANHFFDKQGKENSIYHAHQGICFESQFYPDSPNKTHFPSAKLTPEDNFYSVTEYEVVFY